MTTTTHEHEAPQRALTPYERTRNTLEAALPQIQRALPRHLTADRLYRAALTEIRVRPKLVECNPLSLLSEIAQAAQCGLEIGGPLGQCWLIPYGKEAKLQIGYKGAAALVWRSGMIKAIYPGWVHEGDLFDHQMGTDPKIVHRPSDDEDRDDKPITHVYVVIETVQGGKMSRVMSHAQIEKHGRRYSKAYKAAKQDSPWLDPLGWRWMAAKTVLLQLVKVLELSPEDRRLLQRSEDAISEIQAKSEQVAQTAGKVLDHLAGDAQEIPQREPPGETSQGLLPDWIARIEQTQTTQELAQATLDAAQAGELTTEEAERLVVASEKHGIILAEREGK